MSVIAAGVDLCDMRRIEQAIDRFGDRFLMRVFTPTERKRAERRSGQARIGAYAKRWAAKEACAKALGTGFAQGVAHSLIGVENLETGQPTLVLKGAAQGTVAGVDARRVCAPCGAKYDGRAALRLCRGYYLGAFGLTSLGAHGFIRTIFLFELMQSRRCRT